MQTNHTGLHIFQTKQHPAVSPTNGVKSKTRATQVRQAHAYLSCDNPGMSTVYKTRSSIVLEHPPKNVSRMTLRRTMDIQQEHTYQVRARLVQTSNANGNRNPRAFEYLVQPAFWVEEASDLKPPEPTP